MKIFSTLVLRADYYCLDSPQDDGMLKEAVNLL